MVEEFAEVLRKRGLQIDPRASARLCEAELRGVQEIAAQGWERAFVDLELRCGTVERVAHNWMPQGGEVHANLMRASGVKLNFDEAGVVDASEGAPIGARFAGVAQHDAAACGHARAISRVARYGEVDTAACFLEMTLDEREVRLLHFALAKRFAQFRVGGVVFRHQDDARGAFVQAMHDAGAKGVTALRERLPAAKQRIHQRAAGITSAGVYGHSRWLVDGQDVVIFVENIERDGLGLGAQRRARPDLNGDVFAASEAMRALGWAGIDEHEALDDELLHASSADVLEAGSDALIEAFAGLIFGNDEFMERGFAALAHREIVAAVTMTYRAPRASRVERGVKAEASFRYSIIVDSATNFRVWSLRVTGVNIALRVTKLRKKSK